MRRGFPYETSITCKKEGKIYVESRILRPVTMSWDREERRTLSGHTDVVAGCAISPSGDIIVSASSDDTLKVWDARTGVCLNTLYVNGPLNACAFHPDGEHLVAVGAGGMYFLRWVR